MSEEKKVPKKKPLKDVIKLSAPLIPILGILAIIIYLFYRLLLYNNIFSGFLGIWLGVLELNIDVTYILYLEKNASRGPITRSRYLVIMSVQYAKTLVYILTAIDIFVGGFLLVMYGAATSGLTKIPAPITSWEAIVILLLLIPLPLLAHVTKREAEKVIRLETESATGV